MTDLNDEKTKWESIYEGEPETVVPPAVSALGDELTQIFDKLFEGQVKILEAGSGTGAQSLAFAESDKYDVHLQDFSENALKHAKALYAAKKVEAVFELGNLFEHSTPDFDLVYNFGVLEHYSFEEQVQALEAMASRSKRYVAVAVPNSSCIWYWLWRTGTTSIHGWPYGYEIPLPDLEKAFKQAGLEYLGHQYVGKNWTENFIIGLPDISDFQRDLFLEAHKSGLFDEAQSSYLTLAFGSRTHEPNFSTKGWHRSIYASDMAIPKTITKISESVSNLISLRHQDRQTASFKRLSGGSKSDEISETSLKEEIVKQKNQLKRLRDTQTQESIRPFERILQSIENLKDQHKAELETVQKRIVSLETKQKQISKEHTQAINQTQNALQALSQNNQILGVKQEEAHKSHNNLINNMQNTMGDVIQSNKILIERQEETIRLNTLQQRKLNEAELTTARLETIQRSLSWRITYPFRLISGLFKLLFGVSPTPQNKLSFLKQKIREVGFLSTVIWVLNWLSTRHLPTIPQHDNSNESDSGPTQSAFKKVSRSKEPLFHAAHHGTQSIPTMAMPDRKHTPSIMMFADNFTTGGVERVMLDLSIQMSSQNFSIVVVITNKASDLIKELDQYGIPYFSLEGDADHLDQIISDYNVKLVYSHYGFGMIDIFGARNIPIIEVLHNAYHWQREDQGMVDFRTAHIHSFVAVSEFVANYNQTYLRIPPEKIKIIHNGMDTKGFIRPPIELLSKNRLDTIAEHPKLLFVANLHPQKNHRLIIHAFKKVYEKFPSATLTIAGEFNTDAALGKVLQADIEKLALSENIHFPGLLDRKALSRLMSEAHVAILPTLFEGFSIASLEYTYFGLPSILSRTGAADYLKETYGHVKVVPEAALPMKLLSSETVEQNIQLTFEDAIQPLAEEIIDVLENYELWLEKACKAACAHEKYSIQSTAISYIKAYEATIS